MGVSGGGTIDNNGVMTGGATVGGPYTVTATSGKASGTGQAWVLNSRPLVDGVVKDLLSLRTSSGSPCMSPPGGDYGADVLGVVGEKEALSESFVNQLFKDGGSQGSYTWKAEHDDDGVWAKDYGCSDFVSYWALTVISPCEQKVRIQNRHDDGIYHWANGTLTMNLTGSDYGRPRATEEFTLYQGRNVLLVKLLGKGGSNSLQMWFLDENGDSLKNLHYTLGASGEEPYAVSLGTMYRRLMPAKVAVETLGGQVWIDIPSHEAHAVRVLALSGRTVMVKSGTRPARYRLSRGILPAGVYVVRVKSGKEHMTRRVCLH